MPIEDFNKKFNLTIPDNNIKKLELNNKQLGDAILDFLSHMEFNELIKLYLGNNNITNLKKLEFVKFDKLEKLSLVENKITDINV